MVFGIPGQRPPQSGSTASGQICNSGGSALSTKWNQPEIWRFPGGQVDIGSLPPRRVLYTPTGPDYGLVEGGIWIRSYFGF